MTDIKCTYTTLGYREGVEVWIGSYFSERALKDNQKTYKIFHNGKTSIKKEEIVKFFEELSGGEVFNYSLNGHNEEHHIVNKNTKTIISLDITSKVKSPTRVKINALTTDKECFKEIVNWIRKNLVLASGSTVYTIGQTSRGLKLQEIGKATDVLEKDNYSKEVVEKVDYCIEQLNQENPNGRLVIINGKPGAGKTYLIKGMIPKIQNSVVILIPSTMVTEIDGPALASTLSEWREMYAPYDKEENPQNPSIVFIIEDADHCLTTRNDANMSAVSSMLNHTDGIFGSLLDLRIIATTNAHQLEFDQAFTRPGRLCAHIIINELEPEHASKVYKRLADKEKEYNKPVTLGQVYADANNNPYGYTKEEKKVGFT